MGETDDPDAADRYHNTRAAFEYQHGEIIGEYWSITKPSAVAVTQKRSPFLTRAFIHRRFRFHRATDWVTKGAPDIADALLGCETLAIQATEVLTPHSSERVALRRILAVASHLLGFIDRTRGRRDSVWARAVAQTKKHALSTAVKAQKDELDKIRHYYEQAGARIGRIVYTLGMIAGLFVVALFAVPLRLFGPLEWTDRGVQICLLCYGAGALGAFVSVLQRMTTEKFDTHFDLGRRTLYVLGSYRPVLGAVFGVVTYFALASGLLQAHIPTGKREIFFYGSLAFVAGFSERFTSVLIRNVAHAGSPAGTETVRAREAQEWTASAPIRSTRQR
jgi:hypothetical protein